MTAKLRLFPVPFNSLLKMFYCETEGVRYKFLHVQTDQLVAVSAHAPIFVTSLGRAAEMKNVPGEISRVMHQNLHFSNLDPES